MNNTVLIGRLTKDPELRFTKSGKAVATFTLAVNRTFSKSDEADFINIVTWQKTAENSANYLGKGSQCAVNGRIQSRTYDDKDGKRVYVTEVVANEVEFLDPKSKTKDQQSNKPDGTPEENDVNLDEFQALDDDEDIPF